MTIQQKDFRAFRTKIFVRTIIMVFISILMINLLYPVVLQGRFATFMIDVFQKAFLLDYDAAFNLYQQIFRRHFDLIMIGAVSIAFLIVFRIYLNWFTKYFEEINNGMDSLINENTEDISLSAELLPLERKLNTVKHTIEKQKNDMLTAEQRKNDLIMYLAHDLKTPLASVIGYLNLLHDEKQISDELREKYLSVSLDKAERLEDLINEFFEISKYNLSTITLQYSKINLARLLEMLLYEFQPMLKEKNLTCNLNVSEDITMKCDANKIQRVFDNLLKNAVIYSFDGTNIDITVAEQDNSAVIQLTNHCDTVPKEKLDRIFEQFYRLDTARSSQSGGAGLGLAIAKEIIELHKGSITAKSENEIMEFVVSIPLS
ncbi:MAG: HAMP domain-containing histidine kinase [Acetatifactor sp.]|nr:HAMP domain-containing histidine kinase [Acetatifactor sp.]